MVTVRAVASATSKRVVVIVGSLDLPIGYEWL